MLKRQIIQICEGWKYTQIYDALIEAHLHFKLIENSGKTSASHMPCNSGAAKINSSEVSRRVLATTEENKMEQTEQSEPNFRVNVKQSAKGQSYFDVTVRGDTKEDVERRLIEACNIAKEKCIELNEVIVK